MKLRQSRLAVLLLVAVTYGCSPSDPETTTKSRNVTTQTTSTISENDSSMDELVRADSGKAAELPKAQLFESMGNHERKITTDNLEAQQYFNQGLTWMYAFNHDEAIRSFRCAAELDDTCAMAWWGASLAAGPQYNHPVMTEERTGTAWEAMQKALARIENTTPFERVLIKALQHRNADPEPEDRTDLNEAYARAMGKIWEEYPDDADVGALCAEAMMVRRPWKLYSPDFEPHEETPKIIATLERVLQLQPDHPGALHLYIHVMEASGNPDQGLAAADRLCDLVPASGHLLHMPSHLYVKTGRWEQAVVQNAKAMRSDKMYRVLSPEQRTQHIYMTHNAHVLAFAAMMSGREQEAMVAARDMWENLTEDILRELGPRVDRWMCSVYDVQKRFGRWDDILDEPSPPDYMPITTATWRAARAIAYAAKKDFTGAQREYDAFKIAKANVPEDVQWGRDAAVQVLEAGEYFIAGEIALQHGEWDRAAKLLEKAAEVEDALSYGQPPQWLQPIRHTLGAVYLKAGRYQEAEHAYREDLAKWPDNGWSLYGLSRALDGQARAEEARQALNEHQRIWTKADAPIATSCKCIPKT